MDCEKFLEFLRDIAVIVAILIGLNMLLSSGFMPSRLKIESNIFTIEVFGNEKSTQPDQE